MKAHCTCLRSFIALLPISLLFVSCMFAQNRDLQTIRLTDRVSLPVPRAWRVIPKTTRGLDELYLPAGPTQPAGMRLRVAITEEARNDHADALTGLRQIETEYAGPMGYVSLCGWPALQRVATVPTPQRLADVDNEDESGDRRRGCRKHHNSLR